MMQSLAIILALGLQVSSTQAFSAGFVSPVRCARLSTVTGQLGRGGSRRCSIARRRQASLSMQEDGYGFMLKPVEGDELVGMLSDNGEVSIKAVVATGLVKGACGMQKTSPVCSAALGRTMICALLMAQGKKEAEMYGDQAKETLQIDVRGDGPIKQVFAIADGAGEVRGYTANPFVVLPPNDKGKLDVARAVGKGFITVVRNNPFWKQPYNGITSIVSGEIAEDMANYLTESEQTPCALGAGVLVETETEEVVVAGGWLVQMLPGASEETISMVEKNIMNLQMSPTSLIKSGKTARDICDMLSQGLRTEESIPAYTRSNRIKPKYSCKCSIEKVYRTVALLPQSEMQEILQEKGCIEVRCEYCKREYKLGGNELEEVYSSARQ